MPLLQINQILHICASVRLDEATAAQGDQYSAFIRASADDVVHKTLNYVFLKGPRLSGVPKDSAGKAGRFDFTCPERLNQWYASAAWEEGCNRCGIHVLGAGGEGVIGLLILWPCQNGASHRKNDGHVTPNLGTAERSPAPNCLRA